MKRKDRNMGTALSSANWPCDNCQTRVKLEGQTSALALVHSSTEYTQSVHLKTTQQSGGTGWEPGVLGGEDKVHETAQTKENKTGHTPNLNDNELVPSKGGFAPLVPPFLGKEQGIMQFLEV